MVDVQPSRTNSGLNWQDLALKPVTLSGAVLILRILSNYRCISSFHEVNETHILHISQREPTDSLPATGDLRRGF